MDIKEIVKMLPKDFSFYIPQTQSEWRQLEQATLEVLYKIREEKRQERLAHKGRMAVAQFYERQRS